MRSALILFALGCGVLQWQPILPSWQVLLVLAIASALVFAWPLRTPTTDATSVATNVAAPSVANPWWWVQIVAAGILGFAWAAGMAHWRLAETLPDAWEGRDVSVVGIIDSLPQPFERGVRFEFAVETVLTPGAPIPSHLQLAWYGGHEARTGGFETPPTLMPTVPVRAGERWQLTVRLKKPHGSANPHGFDYEAWLLERGIRATGYVRPPGRQQAGTANQRLAHFVPGIGTAVNRLRENIRDRLQAALAGAPYGGVVVALAIGDQRAIDSDDWELFNRTGVGHLMSISGLHVTMIAALFGWIGFTLWRRSERLMLWLPAPKAAALIGFLAALAYCLLAGWGVPAQRTLFMLGVAAWALWRGWFGSGFRVLAIALGLVCLVDPWAPLAPGFWLSFGAVALLLLAAHGRAPNRHWLWTAVSAQAAITVGLTPLTLALFGQVSLAGPLANALAIPVVSFVVTPLSLLAAAIPIDAFATLAHACTDWLVAYLTWLDGFEGAVWRRAAPPWWTVGLAVAGVLFCLAPLRPALRLQGLVWLLPMLLWPAPRPQPGDLWLTVLDVGQGLAIVARTGEHALLYDTGPRYSPDADGGNRVILPYLRGEGIERLDAMVVTHDDNDHTGGAQSVLDGVPVAQLLTSLAADHPLHAGHVSRSACQASEHWNWEGVSFTFLHPPANRDPAPVTKKARDNAASCVLKVTAHGRHALLTADIEADVEGALVAAGAPLAAEVLLAPHHGSKTSSTPPFLAAVNPATIVVPVGYRNRFRHPAPEVLQRYEQSGARLLRTDRDGAVTLRFAAGGITATTWRAERPRYWHGR